MGEVFLKLENIKKSFGGVQALKGVDLEIRKGEILALAGQNGCGKSTLIKVISGVHEQTSGDYYLEGKKSRKTDTYRCDSSRCTGYISGFCSIS